MSRGWRWRLCLPKASLRGSLRSNFHHTPAAGNASKHRIHSNAIHY
jgi:hypothetical protein